MGTLLLLLLRLSLTTHRMLPSTASCFFFFKPANTVTTQSDPCVNFAAGGSNEERAYLYILQGFLGTIVG